MRFRIATLPPQRFLGSLSFWRAQAAKVEPKVSQIYQAFRGGHLEQARQMLDEVLRDHPDGAKAHFVQAEIDAAEGHYELTRAQLGVVDETTGDVFLEGQN